MNARRWLWRCSWALLLLGALIQWGGAASVYAKAHLADYWIAQAWQRTLDDPSAAPRHRPWSWADTWPVARLQWLGPSGVKRDEYVLAGADGSALAFGPGHHSATALPGQGGAVLAGHRDTHFAFLQHLSPGDVLRLQTPAGRWLNYRVVDHWVADSREGALAIEPERDALWLVTCYPFEALEPGGPLRYVVYLEPVARLPGKPGLTAAW